MKPLVESFSSERGLELSAEKTQITQIDEEMRLAARLQVDFLPRTLPEVDGVAFNVFFRPASYVSGDIYDVTRLDEDHIGFFVADALAWV